MTETPAIPDRAEDPLQATFPDYAEHPVPLSPYASILGLYNLAFVLFLVYARSTGRTIPERIEWRDVALLGVATFKLSRIISKDIVTTPLRAPFTQFVEYSGQGEVREEARGEGPQRAAAELLTCPFCLGAWIAALFAYGLVLSPPTTRLVATVLATLCISDFLQFGYAAACEATAEQKGQPAAS